MVRASSQNVGTGGSGKVAVGGKYLFIINGAEEHTAKTGNVAIRLEVEVLAGTIPEQEGKTMKMQDFYPNSPAFFDLAAALGLTDQITGQVFTLAMLKQMRDDAKAKKASDVEYDFSADECAGRMFFANVVPERGQDGKPKEDGWPRIGMEIYSIVDERAKNIPANEAMIAEVLGMTRAEFFAQMGGGAAAGGNAQPAPVGAPVGGGDAAEVDAMFK